MEIRKINSIVVFLILLLVPGVLLAEDGLGDNIVYGGDAPRFVYGFDAYIDSFTIEQAGLYEATLVDYQFPNEFDYIGFMVTQGALDQMGVIEGSGSFTFMADPGIYNAVFAGSVNAASFSDSGMANPITTLGTYGVQVALVPELETWLMMIFGIGGIAYWIRRKNPLRDDSTVALAAA